MTVPCGTANKGKGPIRANGKGLLSFLRREGDDHSKHFANLRRDASMLQRWDLKRNYFIE